jgi:hypothetical protein
MRPDALEAIEQALAGAPDADDALREAVRTLAAAPGLAWAGIAFEERGTLALGPSAGVEDEVRRHRVPIAYRGDVVGELWVDGDADDAFLAAAAGLLSAHVLLGWDTGGEAWEP